MKSKLMIIGLLILSAAMLTTGAFAYFNSETTNTGNISSGTLELRVAGNDTTDCSTAGFGDTTTVWSMANLAPGDEFDGFLCMKNRGSIDSEQVTFEWVYDDVQFGDLADRIFLVSAYDSTDPGDQIVPIIAACDGIIPGTSDDSKCSFAEFAYLSEKYPYPFDAVSGAVSPWLPGGTTQWLYLKYQFDPTAGNEFQGLSFPYTLIVTAEQVAVFP